MNDDRLLQGPSGESEPEARASHGSNGRLISRVIIFIMVLVFIGGAVSMLNPFRTVNAKADLDPALLERGIEYACSSGAVTRTDVFIMNTSAGGYPWDVVAHINASSTSDASVGAKGALRVGESLTAPGLGQFYLVELYEWHGSQMIRILFIPESN